MTVADDRKRACEGDVAFRPGAALNEYSLYPGTGSNVRASHSLHST